MTQSGSQSGRCRNDHFRRHRILKAIADAPDACLADVGAQNASRGAAA